MNKTHTHDTKILGELQGAAVLPHAQMLSLDWLRMCPADKKLIGDIIGLDFVVTMDSLVTDLDNATID